MNAELRSCILGCALAAALSVAAPVRADSAAAEALFREGRRLLLEGRTADACAKLAESQRLDPSSGTAINLAYCHQKLGKTASAWAEFLEAQRLAIAQHNPRRAQEAKAQAAALEPELSRLTVRVAALVPDLKIFRNGDVLEPSALGVPLPVDRGHYEIRLTAPGFNEWRTELEIDRPGEQVVEAPALEPQKSTPPQPLAEPKARATAPRKTAVPSPRKMHTSRAAPAKQSLPAGFWVTGAVAVAATGFAATMGILSISNYAHADDECPSHDQCSATALERGDTAHRQARMADVGFITAAVAAAVAGIIYIETPSSTRSGARANPLSLSW